MHFSYWLWLIPGLIMAIYIYALARAGDDPNEDEEEDDFIHIQRIPVDSGEIPEWAESFGSRYNVRLMTRQQIMEEFPEVLE